MAAPKKKYLIKTRCGFWETHIWYDKRDRAYLVKVPHLPSAVTFGWTLTEAKKMAVEVIELVSEIASDYLKLGNAAVY